MDDTMDTLPNDVSNHPTPTPTISPLPTTNIMLRSAASTPLTQTAPGLPTTPNLLLMQEPDVTQESTIVPDSDLTSSIHAPKTTVENPNKDPLTPSTYTPNEEEQAILAHLALAEKNRAVTSERGYNSITTLPQFTPVPIGGFPLTHASHSAQIFDFLDNQALLAWFQVEHPKFLVRIFDHSGKDVADKAALLSERIRTNIAIVANFVNQEAPAVKVSPPRPNGGKMAKNLPLCFLVHNISEEATNLILSQRIWSATNITFEAHQFNCSHPPSLLFCLSGFTTQETDTVNKTVADVWAHGDNRHQIDDILSMSEIPEDQVHKATYDLINSIRVEYLDFKVSGGLSVPRFNIFARSPTHNAQAWTDLRSFLRSLEYPTGLDGCGSAVAVPPCTICHSIAHPRGLCPFPGIPLWNGPKSGNKNTPNAARNKGKGRNSHA